VEECGEKMSLSCAKKGRKEGGPFESGSSDRQSMQRRKGQEIALTRLLRLLLLLAMELVVADGQAERGGPRGGCRRRGRRRGS